MPGPQFLWIRIAIMFLELGDSQIFLLISSFQIWHTCLQLWRLSRLSNPTISHISFRISSGNTSPLRIKENILWKMSFGSIVGFLVEFFSFTVNFRCKSLIKYQQAPISCESESAQTALPTEQIITQYTGPTIHQSEEETIVSDLNTGLWLVS